MTAINRDEAGLELATADALFSSSVRRLARAAAGSFGLSVLQMLVTTLTTIVLARVMGVSDYGAAYALNLIAAAPCRCSRGAGVSVIF